MGRVKEMLQFEVEAKHREECLQWEGWEEAMEALADQNPYPRRSKPIPFDPDFDGRVYLAWELFNPDVLQGVIEENRDWLQDIPRSSQTILKALFRNYVRAGMTDEEILYNISGQMFLAGYRPSSLRSNPIWTFPV